MDTNIKLSQKAYEYLDHGDTKSAEKILNMLKKKENTPELKFIYDDSISYGEHIEDIIDKINDNKV